MPCHAQQAHVLGGEEAEESASEQCDVSESEPLLSIVSS